MSILDKIVAHKRGELATMPDESVESATLQAKLHERGRRDFVAALENPRAGDVALIAEVKKASPSAGVIRENFDPVKIALQYEAAGASCLSVLTDENFFKGSLQFLRDIRAAVELPLLRKDFIIDERQVDEAAEWGADAILLIVAILDDGQLDHLHDLATSAGLAALVEVHDEAELDRALSAGANLIGINNRNLNDFSVDLTTSTQLANSLTNWQGMLVGESGIHSRGDVEVLRNAGMGAILVGESLMRAADLHDKAAELLGTG